MSKTSSSLIAFACLVSLNGCVPAVIGGAAVGAYFVGTDDRPVKTIASDGSITSEINARMIKDSRLSALRINVDTYEGAVTLSGTVHNEEAVWAAEDIARHVRGVRAIQNNIIYQPK